MAILIPLYIGFMKRLSRPSHLMINTTAAHPQGKEKSMEKPKYRMDLDFLKQFDHCTNRYEPFDVVATAKGSIALAEKSSSSASSPPKLSFTILPPISASSTKATQWSMFWMYPAN